MTIENIMAVKMATSARRNKNCRAKISKSIDVISLLILFLPIWWTLGVEQIIWTTFLMIAFFGRIIQRKNIVFGKVGKALFVFLLTQILSGIFIEESYRYITFIRTFSAYFAVLLIILYLSSREYSWVYVKKILESIIFIMSIASILVENVRILVTSSGAP